MERLGPQDASFIYLETPAVHQHVGGLAILDPSTRPDRLECRKITQGHDSPRRGNNPP